ncbi:receptor-interacting serine serine/threonine-protein kinase 2 isoform X1 [Solea senegalensis]|uniref:Receptor-interacting serine/threonine-protein kinase 2 n=1 Tax=Solea senegalensis TaxID=28829 RepID=A0AAV6TBB6_SOLSE|nr:receptor-interacting serine/threonine-protein kinase 2-like [Solea senegalensis]KAG7526685.1 receptor-interacting serine serine/threonine-protein kinase 2 isoform X1 [Solea senegalensis]
MESCASAGCVNMGNLTSTLPVIRYQKLTDLYYLSRGGFGTVFKAQHSDWRTTVAIKCLKLDSPFGERERNCLLKEAEVLHKARFNYIIQIFGICNEPEFFCIVTEFMSNGSLDLLLHEKDMYPVLAWPLRLRILYEIALGVNFLHNMNPPLLHHDLKTQNILLDGEFHVKIADFGLSKWRQLSVSKGSGPIPTEMGGTVIYMPPEEYEQSKSRRADVKHDMYSYAIIMWEVLSRQIPFEEVTNPMTIMFRVLHGMRPDTSLDSLPVDIPSRGTLISLMTCGWTANPDERPSFLKCLIELEPMVRNFDEVEFLEAVLQIQRSKLRQRSGCCSAQSTCENMSEEGPRNILNNRPSPWPESNISGPGSCSSQDTDISLPGALVSSNTDSSKEDDLPCSARAPSLEPPGSLIDHNCFQSTRDMNDLNCPTNLDLPECETQLDKLALKPQPLQQDYLPPLQQSSPSPGPITQWIATHREAIVCQMTEACLNQSLDALLARSMLMREDYELVTNQPTRAAKVRQLLDNCHRHDEDFCHIVVRKLHDNKQMGLQPYPAEISSPTTTLVPNAPPLSMSYNIPRNI